MAEVPVIQILDKKNYFKQALVPLPNALPLPPLGESSLRVRTEVLCVTSNNFSYCRHGEMFGWWDVHPIPPSTPAPYNDASTYGRINCWGYAKVIDSTFAGVPKGSFVWGYLPIGTLPQDFQVKQGNVPNQFIVTEPYRQKQLPVYNRYMVFPETLSKEIEARSDGIAYDSLARVMHLTAYLMTDFMFPPDPSQSVSLTPAQADLTDATIVVFAPGSKVGLAMAHLLRHQRPAGKPRRVLAAASESSRPFVEATGLYDAVVSTGADPVEALAGAPKDKKVVIVDFGGRAGVAWKWAAQLAPAFPKIQVLAVGFQVSDPTEQGEQAAPPAGVEVLQVMADDLLTAAIAKVGEREYFEGMFKSWEGLRKDGFKGFRVNWGEGMEAVKEAWDRFARNEAQADEGLVFKL
ncbi:hypothetical protein F4804DRAFT_311939 [Jackrogersella minutella]|nr:hypothetical protein F4804DRAFT_311939 [Jackrogersella minutella]